ncbi:DMT family transporter [Nonomuraea glycinis]|uniref:DMT family transporter n=1 Tax=Nonomuraea glycinis TaxID=2047744 RepID=UPI002E13364B|nr:hypothetical protein OHA68_32430 [Nonomuraea glycinis]
MTWLAIILAILNACCFTVGTWLQHGASAGGASLASAVRRPRWLAGLALLALGAVMQVNALRLAPVTVIEPVGVLGIVISVVWALRVRRAPLRWNIGRALATILVGTSAFAVLAALNTVTRPVSTAAQFQAGALVAAAVAVCLLLAHPLRGRARCLVLGMGGGIAYGCTSVLIRAATEQFTSYGVSAPLFGTLAGLGATVLAGFWLVQRAYADGPAESTVATLTVVDPLVAVTIGIGLLGEAPGLTLPIAALGLAFAAVAVGGVVLLSRDIPAPPSSSLTHDRSTPCPAVPSGASSSARTPTRPM